MARPKLCLLPDDSYSYRIDFRFVNPAGDHLKSQTWELTHGPDEAPQILLLQANARLVGDNPTLQEIGLNYVSITIAVTAMEGPLSRSVFSTTQQEALTRQLAAFTLTFVIVAKKDKVKFVLLTAPQQT